MRGILRRWRASNRLWHSADVGRRLARAGLELPSAQSEALARFLDLLIRWNRVYNLTGIRDSQELVDRHSSRASRCGRFCTASESPTSAPAPGLPGLPLAIAEPERAFTLIESRAKRVRFLRQVIVELGLRNAVVAHGRAEHLRPEQPFATVLARAVAPPAELLEICRNLTAPGSILLLLTAAHLQTQFAGLAPDFVQRAGRARTRRAEAQELDRVVGADGMTTVIASREPEGRRRQDDHRVNLAASLAATQRRVLLVDLDPQANATMGSGVDKNALERTICDVLLDESAAAERRCRRRPKAASRCCRATRS